MYARSEGRNAIPSLLMSISMGKRDREDAVQPPIDDGMGPLLFYTANKDGASSAGSLLHDQDRNGARSVLSNFAKTPFELEFNGYSTRYATVENAFQAMKYLKFATIVEHDPAPRIALANAYREYAHVIGQAKTPNRAFMLAQMKLVKDRSRPNFSTADRTFLTSADATAMQKAFDSGVRSPSFEVLKPTDRIAIMDLALEAKFDQNPSARGYLDSTGTRVLVEHTTRDGFWGDGGSGLDEPGHNHLGKALMRIRDRL